jgi:hypothetical protein
MVVAVKRPVRRKGVPAARTAGSAISARLQRWPVRNHFHELEEPGAEAHPVDRMVDRQPEIRRAAARARRVLAAIQRQGNVQVVLEFEEARNRLDWARVEVAYNLGFESGLIRGRAERLRRKSSRPTVLDAALTRMLSKAQGLPSNVVALSLIELTHALLLGSPPAAPGS